MSAFSVTAAIIFLLTYIGVALGRVPGLMLDRTGIALLGAIANLIVIEQAKYFHVTIPFKDHARIGIPVTAASLLILFAWMYVMPL